MIPLTTDRLFPFSDRRPDDCVSERTRESVARYASASPKLLEQRLREMDGEWDVDRICHATLGVTGLAGLVPAVLLGPGWLVVPGVVLGMLALQGLTGWRPLCPLFREMGFRTSCEIGHERYALKALRGDFQRLDAVMTPQDREDLSRFEDEGGPALPEPRPDASDPEIVNEAIRAARS